MNNSGISSDLDGLFDEWYNQCLLKPGEFEELLKRSKGRVKSYKQILLTANPETPDWMYDYFKLNQYKEDPSPN